jgi:hypothetical protein
MLRGEVEPATRPAISNGKMNGVSDIWRIVVLSGIKAVYRALVADKSKLLISPASLRVMILTPCGVASACNKSAFPGVNFSTLLMLCRPDSNPYQLTRLLLNPSARGYHPEG